MLLANMAAAHKVAAAFPRAALLRLHPPPHQGALLNAAKAARGMVRAAELRGWGLGLRRTRISSGFRAIVTGPLRQRPGMRPCASVSSAGCSGVEWNHHGF